MESSKKENNEWSVKHYLLLIAGLIVLILLITLAQSNNDKILTTNTPVENKVLSVEEQVLPSEGFTLPISWDDIGAKMISVGVIDTPRFEALYQNRGGLNPEDKRLLYNDSNEKVVIKRDNAGVLLNLLWAFGLSNKNEILEEGPMNDKGYGGDPSRFASTGGWSIAVGHPMEHYSMHEFTTLTDEQQERVERVAKGIYRPCCGNSTHFPDCNHGMAMLGLLELMAVEGLSEKEMFEVALQVNSFWFPETYLTLATYFEEKGISWNEIDPKVALGADYSSSSGYQRILQEMKPIDFQIGGGCSV